MKKIILLFFITTALSNKLSAQFSIYPSNDGQIIINKIGGKPGEINFYDKNPSEKGVKKLENFKIEYSTVFNDSCSKDSVKVELNKNTIVTYVKDCTKKIITFFSGKIKSGEYELGNKNEFVAIKESTELVNRDLSTTKYKFSQQIPYPLFSKKDDRVLPNSKTNRYLFIDATPNTNKKISNSLFKVKDVDSFGKTDNFEENFIKANALTVNGSLSILVRNYNFHDLEKVSVDIIGADYTYTLSIKDILAQIKTAQSSTGEKIEKVDENFLKQRNDTLTNNLSNVLDSLKSYTYLNLNDLYQIEDYKNQLINFYNNNFENFSKNEIDIFNEITNWYPKYLSVTPIAITIPENDDVEIKVTIKNKSETSPNQVKVGLFKTTGGIGFNLGGMFYITNLKDNAIYTKASETDGKVRAFMNSKNQNSVGLGLNSEIYFRTGYLLRPTLNMGFFVPFDEDLTPFAAIGPGITIASKKVKFSFSWGLAVGKINSIKEEYQNIEFDSANLTNEQLGEKIWQFKNYFGFGLTYNLSN
jgi:hypothetical protein